jgi:hypothetical protein
MQEMHDSYTITHHFFSVTIWSYRVWASLQKSAETLYRQRLYNFIGKLQPIKAPLLSFFSESSRIYFCASKPKKHSTAQRYFF